MSQHIWVVSKEIGKKSINDDNRYFSSKKKALEFITEKIEYIENHWSLGDTERLEKYKGTISISFRAYNVSEKVEHLNLWIAQRRVVY